MSERTIARAAGVAAISLVVRQAVVQGANVLGGIALARLRSPADFGVYGVMTFLLSLFVALSDVGLSASLIRDPAEPTTRDLRLVLALQHLLTAALALALWGGAGAIAAAYHLPADSVWMFRLLALALPVTALQSVSAIVLERHVRFPVLARVEIVQALVYNLAVVGLVWRGAGVVAFGWAMIARAVSGAVLGVAASPWRVGWAWDTTRVRQLLRFGLPYQAGTLVSVVKDSITPILLGLTVGTVAVDQANWANMVAAYPVLALFALQRVYLPSFARLQHDREALARFVATVIRMTNAVVAPLAIGTLVLVTPLTRVVFGEKWLAAVPLFYFLWAANLFVPTVTPLVGLLNALGRSRTTFGFTLLWMVLTWVLAGPAIVRYGALGFAAANAVVQLSNLWLFAVARRALPLRLLPLIAPSWGAAAIMGLVVAGLAHWHTPRTVGELAAVVAVGAVVYVAALAVCAPAVFRAVRLLRSGDA